MILLVNIIGCIEQNPLIKAEFFESNCQSKITKILIKEVSECNPEQFI